MKSKLILTCVVVVVLSMVAFTVVFASVKAKKASGNAMGDPYSRSEVNEQERAERLARMDREKAEIAEAAKNDPEKYESERLTDEEIEALRKKEIAAEEEALIILNYFNEALSVVEEKHPGQFKSSINNLFEVDRNVLYSFVYTLKNDKLSEHDETLLTGCLAENMLIINEADPLYDEIVDLLGIG